MAPLKSQVAGPPKGFKDKPKGGKGKSLSKRAISEISDAARFAEKIGSDKKFSDLAKQYKEYNVRYGRPATFRETYGEEVNKLGDPMGSTYYKDPVTGEERFFTAEAPTFRQLLGDIGGAFSSMGKGLAEKGTPMMQLGKGILGGIQNFFSPKPPVATYGGSSNISVKEIPLVNSDLNVSVNPGASPEFLAAINNPGTMAQDSRLKELLMKNVPGYERLMNLGNTPYGKFGIENLLQGDPRFLYEKNLGPGQLGIQINPLSQSGGFSYGMRFKNGGIATLH